MKLKSRFLANKLSIMLPLVALVLTASIFTLDTITDLDIAIAVLYVAIVLMSVSFCETWGVILVSAGCMVLTILSFFLTRSGTSQAGLINTVISLVTIALTAFLVLKIEVATTAANDLAQSERLRDALIGSVSHDLRTPLASILGSVSILASAPTVVNDTRLAPLAESIRDEAICLNNDIQNLLDAARITSHGLRSRNDWTDPNDIINAAIERISLRFPERRIDLNIGKSLPLINVDPVLVEQGLGQIIANAAKFSHPDSTIHVAAIVENRQLIISVRDEGVGLATDEKDKILERLFRGERHIGKIPGSGLGMWIANTFIMSSGGKLETLSPGVGQGTTIKIVLPISFHSDESESISQED